MKSAGFFWKNPVLVKEIRTRMRGNRAFLIVTLHLLLLSALIFLVYGIYASSMNTSNLLEERRTLSRVLFGMLVSLEMVMISFTAPALTSGMISSEREHQTLELLQVTLLKPAALVFGKYASGLVFLLLLLFTAIPLQSPAFLIGGVRAEEIIIGVLILVITAITFCAAGIFFSSLFKRTLVSTVMSYAFAIFLVFGVPLLGLFLVIILSNFMSDFLNSLATTLNVVLLVAAWLLMSVTPAATIVASEAFLLDQNNIWLLRIDVPYSSPAQIWLPSPWIIYVLFYTLLSLILLAASVMLVRRVEN